MREVVKGSTTQGKAFGDATKELTDVQKD